MTGKSLNKFGVSVLCAIIVSALFSVLICPCYASDNSFNGDTISVVTDDTYPPFSFRDNDGKLQGISIDLWDLWSEETGIDIEITGMPWAEAQRSFEAGEYDVLDTPVYTAERSEKYEFSNPYAKIDSAIFFDNRISGITGPESLEGFVVAVKSGDALHEYLLNRGLTDFSEYDSYEAVILAVKEGNEKVFAMDIPQAEYYLYQSGIHDGFSRTIPLYSAELHRAVLKGNTSLLNIIDNGFASIPGDSYDKVNDKWYGTPWISNDDLRYFILFIVIFLVCFLLLGVWSYILKIRVRDRTRDLVNEIEYGKKQASELRESEERFREIFDNINDAVFLISAPLSKERGGIISVNRAACDMLGYTEEEMLNLNISEYHSEDRVIEKINLMLLKSDNAIVETEYIGKDGRTIPVEASVHYFFLGDRGMILAVARDISERLNVLARLEESESRYRNVVEDQTELICRFKRDRTIIFANNAFCKYFKFDRKDIVGKRIDFEVFPEDRERLREHFARLTPENPVALIEHRIIMPDGKVRWQSWSDRAVFDEKGNFVEYQSVGRDITEQKRKDETLAFAAKKLNILNHVTFADIQNFLFCEQGYLQLATDLATDEKQKDFLEKQAKTMDKIAETLKFARNYQDLGITPPEWHNFEKTFVFAISHTNTSNLQKNINISDVSIYSDNLLEMALSILVSRSIAYSLSTTRLSLRYEMAGDMLKIVFEIDGRGISRESADRIFTRGGDPDTGIDLFLTEEVLSVTGITISETGDREKGIRFEILVPPGIFRFGDSTGMEEN